MLLSIGIMLLVGMAAGWLCQRLRLPSLLGMVLTGILLGPYALNLIDGSVLAISADLRRLALIIILTRAGLTLNLADLKKVGRPAVLLCFLPATLEICGMVLLAPRLMGVTLLDAAIMGAVVAAVSPAVIVPKMIQLIEEDYGTAQSIPQMILAGASVDDVFVIVLFSAFTGLAQGQVLSAASFINIPVSILLGMALGVGMGYLLAEFWKRFHLRDTTKVIQFLSLSFFLVAVEEMLPGPVTYSGLISIMFVGIGLQHGRLVVAQRLSSKFNKLWVFAQVVLFVLVGATVDLHYAAAAGAAAVVLIFGVLVFRMMGVALCLLGTRLNPRERLFCIVSYLPKATVQAAIGGVPLAMGLSCGNTVLTVAVLAIIITAPLGAFLIDITYKRFLQHG